MVNEHNRVDDLRDTMFTPKARSRRAVKRTIGLRASNHGIFAELSSVQVSSWICAYYNGEDPEILDKEVPALTLPEGWEVDYTNVRGLERLAFFLMLAMRHSLKKSDNSRSVRGFGGIRHGKEPWVSAVELRKDRSDFCAAVRWLCSYKEVPRNAADGAGKRKAIKKQRHRYLDPASRSSLIYLEMHGLLHVQTYLWMPYIRRSFIITSTFKHWIDLFCSFLLSECERKPLEEYPVKICRLCGRLFSVAALTGDARWRKTYCSTKCQQDAFWTPKRRAEDRYVRRFELYEDNALVERWEEPLVQKRFRAIKRGWPPKSKIVSRIQELKTRVTNRLENPAR